MRSSASVVLLAALCAAPTAWAGPPIQSPIQAVGLVRAAKTPERAKAAVASVKAACRGKLRHALRDHAGLLSAAKTMSAAQDPEVRRAALDLDACFSAAKFVTVVAPRFEDEAPKVQTYAAEVAARLADPVVVPPLLAALEKRKASCLDEGLEADRVEVCVWLTYAPGAALETADEQTRKRAAARAVEMFAAPHPKVREVAVETVASAKIAAHAKDIAKLIAAEKKGVYEAANDAALLGRFEKRRKALSKR